MNAEQIKSAVRSTVIMFGGIFAGWFAARGWLTSEQVMAVLTSEGFVGIIAYIGMLAWGVVAKTGIGLVMSAANVPEVQKIVVNDSAMAREVNPKVTATVTTGK